MRPLSTSSKLPRLAISAGEPAGIGPDTVLVNAQADWPAELVVIADRDMLESRARLLNLKVRLRDYDPASPRASVSGSISLIHEPLAVPSQVAIPDTRNAAGVLRALRRGADGCQSGEFDALVTAPINKAVINDSGTAFSGHTEFLAELTGAKHVVMLLTAKALRVALATTHLPLSQVPSAITTESLLGTLRIIHRDLVDRFAISAPRISVLGLNPHAGEGGHLGHEDAEVVAPAIEAAQAEGIRASGPWPADTAFNRKLLKETDAYLAMYHDQGLPVLKYASFGAAVNVTLGLPIIRCSVDHGTAFDVAGTGKADSSSLAEAIGTALEMCQRRVFL
ncbi:MAG: 4-hydroxythreonine-4-phosphate dehydrogenase PdxA [Congregibacter sp.]